MQGKVKEYNRDRGFGFIIGEDGDDYFVHISGIGPKLQKFGLREGQHVAFDIDYDHKGNKVINIRPI